MSRIGKIARLPRAVREELNRRLEDGEQQGRLVEWLNGREEVQSVLKAEFAGRPINEPNMTAWAQGGFEDWRREQESIAAAGRMVEETAELDVMCGGRGLADRAAMMAALAIGEQLMAVRRIEDGAEKRKAVLKLVRGLVRLRKSDRECERGQREAAQAARTAEIHEHWAEGARRRPPPADARRQRSEHGHPHGDVRARMAEIVGRMSDEQIAETLRVNGYLRAPAEDGRQGTEDRGRRTEGGEARRPERVGWTDEDEVIEGGEAADDGMEGEDGEAGLIASTSTSTESNADVPSASILRPEGEST